MEVVAERLERPAGGTAGELRRRLVVRVLSGEREVADNEELPPGPLRLAVALEEESKRREEEEAVEPPSPSPPSSPEPVVAKQEAVPAPLVAQWQSEPAEEEEDEQWQGSLLPRSVRAAAERDVERQRSMPPQPPLSPAYLAAVPAGRRAIYKV